jgi:hypothetical protein
MSSSPIAKSIIAVPQESYDEIVAALGKKRRILFHFHGDSYKTRIWRDASGALRAKDPEHEEERYIEVNDTQAWETEGKAGTLKGFVILALVKLGHKSDSVFTLTHSVMPVLDAIQAAEGETTAEKIEQIQKIVHLLAHILEEEKTTGKKPHLAVHMAK